MQTRVVVIETGSRTVTVEVFEDADRVVLRPAGSKRGMLGDEGELFAKLHAMMAQYEDDPRPTVLELG